MLNSLRRHSTEDSAHHEYWAIIKLDLQRKPPSLDAIYRRRAAGALERLSASLVEMGFPDFEIEFDQHLQHTPLRNVSNQYQAQYALESCDTPPENYQFSGYGSASNLMRRSNFYRTQAQREYTFAKEVLGPFFGGINPRYNRVTANRTAFMPTHRRNALLEEIDIFERPSEDPFTSKSPSVISRDSAMTSRNFLYDNVGMVYNAPYQFDHSTSNIPLRFTQGRSSLRKDEVHVTEAGPNGFFAHHFVDLSEALVFAHACHSIAPSESEWMQPRSRKTLRPIPESPFTTDPKVPKYRIKPHLHTFASRRRDPASKELARQFRRDASRWWNTVVNPTSSWADW